MATVANYEPKRTKTGGNGKDLKMKGAIQRRIAGNLAPQNGKKAPSMVNVKKGGVVSSFIKENFPKKFKK